MGERDTERARKWRQKNREHYKVYQREYKRKMRAAQKEKK